MKRQKSIKLAICATTLAIAAAVPCAAADVWNWNLGTATGTFTEASTPNPSTSFFPAPPSGTAYAITQTDETTGSYIELGDPGITEMGTDSAIQLVISHNTAVLSVAKATIHEWASADQFQLNFDLHLDAGSPEAAVTYFYAMLGNGVRYTNTQGINAGSAYCGLRLALNPDQATPSAHWAWNGTTMAWFTQAPAFPRGEVVRVEIFGNQGEDPATVEHPSGDVTLLADEVVYFVNGEVWGNVFPGNRTESFVGNVDSVMFHLTRSTASTGDDLTVTIGNISYGNTVEIDVATVDDWQLF